MDQVVVGMEEEEEEATVVVEVAVEEATRWESLERYVLDIRYQIDVVACIAGMIASIDTSILLHCPLTAAFFIHCIVQNLRSIDWSREDLMPFEKNFYVENPAVTARSEVNVPVV